MAVDQHDVVDLIGTAADGSLHLTISDHLEWGSENDHLLILQEKINRYLAFIESGELAGKYPFCEGDKVFIDVYFMHAPDEAALKFLKLARATIEDAGFGFGFKVLKD